MHAAAMCAAVLLLAAMAASADATPSAALPKPKGIIFVLMDDVGAASLNAYGGVRNATPHLTQMAANGRLYEHMFAMPICAPTRAALVSGRYPFSNGITDNKPTLHLSADNCLLASALPADYVTFTVGKWHVNQVRDSALPDEMMENCEFDYNFLFSDRRVSYYDRVRTYFTNAPGDVDSYAYNFTQPGLSASTNVTYTDTYSPDVLQGVAKSFLTQMTSSQQPFFMYYPMTLAHIPFHDPPGFPSVAGWDAKYTNMLKYADALIGELRQHLRDLAIENDTLIFVSGDNGEDRDLLTIWGPDRITVDGGKASPNDAGSRVPLIVEWPTVIPAGTTSQHLVDITDILPTLVEGTGGQLPPRADNAPVHGLSFYKEMLGQEDGPRRWTFTQASNRISIRGPSYQLYQDNKVTDFVDVRARYQPQILSQSAVCGTAASDELIMLINEGRDLLKDIRLSFNVPAVQAAGCKEYVKCSGATLVCTSEKPVASTVSSTNSGDGSTTSSTQASTTLASTEASTTLVSTTSTEASTTLASTNSTETSTTLASTEASTTLASTNSTEASTTLASANSTEASTTLASTNSTEASTKLASTEASTTLASANSTEASTTLASTNSTEASTTLASTTDTVASTTVTSATTTVTSASTASTTLDTSSCANVEHCVACQTGKRPWRCQTCAPGYLLIRPGLECRANFSTTTSSSGVLTSTTSTTMNTSSCANVEHCIACQTGRRPWRCQTCAPGYSLIRPGLECRSSSSTTGSSAGGVATSTSSTTTDNSRCADIAHCTECQTGKRPWRCQTCSAGYKTVRGGRECQPVVPSTGSSAGGIIASTTSTTTDNSRCANIAHCTECQTGKRPWRCQTCSAGYETIRGGRECAPSS